MLNWAESKNHDTIHQEDIVKASGEWMIDGVDPLRLSQQIWGCLNLCLTGNAYETFGVTPELNGLDAWRRLVLQVEEGKPRLLEDLRERMRRPELIRDLEQITIGMDRFEKVINDYVEAGGR